MNKNKTKFLQFENQIRPGGVMTVVSFFYSQPVHPSCLDIVAKYDHSG